MTYSSPSLVESEHALLGSYQASAASGYDEFLDEDGAIRPNWRGLVSSLVGLPPTELATRMARLDRRVRETGIAYDIFADPNAPSQGWQLDLLPIVISSREWEWLAASLVQRARLFDALLADLYGEQNTMRRGLVPPELVFSDSSYLRPCQGILPRGGPLRFYAADLARGADGRWRVIDSHTETLAGVGFALANRVVHTHVAGDLFKKCNAIRISNYFQDLQLGLSAQAGHDNARIALLTPGPHHQDYFSHAYLARYMGFLLVEGPDLRTKGNRVYLKTLEGLKEIDLIVRCCDAGLIDPLELDPSGFDGPPGLLRVCRGSPGLIVNAAGSAVVQNRGLGPYLPELAKALLGEELMLPDAPRWWLGDPVARQHVLQSLDSVVIRQAQEGTGRPGQAALGYNPQAASIGERERLLREVEINGATLVAEGKIGFSVAPAFDLNGFVPRPFAVRLFVARASDRYEAMPGGLAMTVDPEHAVALSAPDGHTRDVWMLSQAEQRPHVSLWRPKLESARIERSQRVLQSRVADDLFWLGRYCERSDWTMRVMRSALRRLEEDSGPSNGLDAARKCLEMLMRDREQTEPVPRSKVGTADIEQLCRQLISGSVSPRALDKTFAGLYRVAHLARDRLSLEAWHTLSRFNPSDTWVKSLPMAMPGTLLDLLEDGLASIAAFNGLMHENMTRNYGWSFLDMGRRLERAYNLSEAVLMLFVPPSDPEQESSSLMLLLELADSFITYRSRYRLDPLLPLVLDLLLLDESNPRALACQLAAISKHLESLPDSRHGVSMSEDRRLILSLQTTTRLADIVAVAEEPQRASLERLLEQQLTVLPELSNAVARHYFNLTDEAPHRLHQRSEIVP